MLRPILILYEIVQQCPQSVRGFAVHRFTHPYRIALTGNEPDDYEAIKELVKRRFKDSGDGFRVHLSYACLPSFRATHEVGCSGMR